MFEELKFRFNYYWMDIEMWWDDLWMSDKEKAEIKESLRKRRESGGCSMWSPEKMNFSYVFFAHKELGS